MTFVRLGSTDGSRSLSEYRPQSEKRALRTPVWRAYAMATDVLRQGPRFHGWVQRGAGAMDGWMANQGVRGMVIEMMFEAQPEALVPLLSSGDETGDVN